MFVKINWNIRMNQIHICLLVPVKWIMFLGVLVGAPFTPETKNAGLIDSFSANRIWQFLNHCGIELEIKETLRYKCEHAQG